MAQSSGAIVDIVAIDPGVKKGHAVAVLREGQLVQSIMARDSGQIGLYSPMLLVIERPQVRGGSASKDVLDLCWEASKVLHEYTAEARYKHYNITVREVLPSQWTNSAPKPVNHLRLWEELSTSERELLGGHTTWSMIYRAVSKGASERWSKAGGAYYPRSSTVPDRLDSACIGKWSWKKWGK